MQPPTSPPSPVSFYSELVDRLAPLAIGDARIRALWIEAADRRSLRRPYGKLAVHAMAGEPDFPALVEGWEALLGTIARLGRAVWSDATRNARQLQVEMAFEGQPGHPETVTFILECAAFLAKRPRQAVVALVDKTDHLIHVMDFSKR